MVGVISPAHLHEPKSFTIGLALDLTGFKWMVHGLSGSCHLETFHAARNQREVAQGQVPARWDVAVLGEMKDGRARLAVRVEPTQVKQLASDGAKMLSSIALS